MERKFYERTTRKCAISSSIVTKSLIIPISLIIGIMALTACSGLDTLAPTTPTPAPVITSPEASEALAPTSTPTPIPTPEPIQKSTPQSASAEVHVFCYEEFKEHFSRNPIDRAYREEMYHMLTTFDMEYTLFAFSRIWREEISWAYQQIFELTGGEAYQRYRQEYVYWLDTVDSERLNLNYYFWEFHSVGGSMDRVSYPYMVMFFYRERARLAFQALFRYDREYTYFFKLTRDDSTAAYSLRGLFNMSYAEIFGGAFPEPISWLSDLILFSLPWDKNVFVEFDSYDVFEFPENAYPTWVNAPANSISGQRG